MTEKPRGILRNKLNQEELAHTVGEHLDRQEVIRNTQINAQLVSESSKGDEIRAKLAAAKAHDHNSDAIHNTGEIGATDGTTGGGEHLKWDEINLYKSEQEKSATMKIDEPKTPYVGGFNPQGEYYKDEDDEIPDFVLGEGELDASDVQKPETNDQDDELVSAGGSDVVEEVEYQQEKESMAETAEERHRRFEELRKQHYHMKGEALKHSVSISDDDDDDDDEQN